MDLALWLLVTSALLGAAQAENVQREPQKEHQNREQSYQVKEVIMYLTPSQIQALNSGNISPEQAGQLSLKQQPPTPQTNLEPPSPGLHREAYEADRKNRQQLPKGVQNQPTYNQEQNRPQLQNVLPRPPQKLQEPQQLRPSLNTKPQFYLPPGPQNPEENRGNLNNKSPHSPDNYAYLYLYPQPQQGKNPQLIPQLHSPQRNIQFVFPPQVPKPNILPQNFQLIPYEFGNNKGSEVHTLPQPVPEAHPLTTQAITNINPNPVLQPEVQALPEATPEANHLLVEPQPQIIQQNPTLVQDQLLHLIPEAMPLLHHHQHVDFQQLKDLELHKLNAQQFELPPLDGFEDILKAHLHELGALQATHQNQHELKLQLEAQLAAQQHAVHESDQLQAHELKIQLGGPQLTQHQLEHIQPHELKVQLAQQAHLEAQEHAAHILSDQQRTHELIEQFESQEQGTHELNSFPQFESQNQGSYEPNPFAHFESQKLSIHEPNSFKSEELKVHLKAEESKNRFEAEKQKSEIIKAQLVAQQQQEKQQLEVLRMDAHHEIQELKAEAEKIIADIGSPRAEKLIQPNGNQKLNLFEPNVGQFNTLPAPLIQHQIEEQLKTKVELENNPPALEQGFQPVKQLNIEGIQNYNKEVEKIIKNAQLEKQEYLAKAAAGAQESLQGTKKAEQPLQLPITKQSGHVPANNIKTYPIEIINHIHLPVVKTEKIEVEKRVPYPVNNYVPVPVTKNVYVPVEKPYFVEKRVPVEIRKPVKIVRKPQKYTILRHVWKH